MPRPVLLLRSASLPEPDAYHSCLSACGYAPRSVPVLETVFVNSGLLEQQLSVPPDVRGVVLTSSRSVEAWRAALAAVYDHDPHAVTLKTWRALPFYVVGAATARALEEADATRPDLPVPSDVRGAAGAGTGEKLARFVLDDLAEDARGARLLYLTGDKNKETLPEILKGGGVILDTVQAYATQGAASFPEDLRRIVEEVPAVAEDWWIVCFAPSSTEFALPHLRKHFSFSQSSPPSSVSASAASLRPALFAAIGPTTTSYLTSVVHLPVAVTSPKPTADALALALYIHDHPDLRYAQAADQHD